MLEHNVNFPKKKNEIKQFFKVLFTNSCSDRQNLHFHTNSLF